MAQANQVTAEKAPRDERTAEQIREDIESKRNAISSTVKGLDDRIHRALDWRTHVSRHPLAAAGIAAGVGAAAVLVVWRPRRPPWERVADAVVDTVEDLRWQLGDSFESMADAVRGHSRKTRRDDDRPTARAAVATAIASATLDFLREKVTAKTERGPGPR